MSKTITRSELEAIGQNWLDRRNRLLEYSDQMLSPTPKRIHALRIAWTLNLRISKIAVLLGKQKPSKEFPSGGVAANIESMQPGEYVISKINRIK